MLDAVGRRRGASDHRSALFCAARAAELAGDRSLAVDGREIESVARLLGRLDDYEVGQTVRLTVLRDGKRTEVPVTLQGASQ